MDTTFPQRKSPLEDQVVEILLERLASGAYPATSRLPSENVIASELRVSRGTVRAALSRLESEGLINRRQGSGTFVRRLTRVTNPLNEWVDYHELITSHGFAYGYQHISARVRVPDAAACRALWIDQQSRALEAVKAFTADGELLIYTLNIIPEWVFAPYISAEEATAPGATEPLWDFLSARCRQPVEDFAATVRPGLARGIDIDDAPLQVDPAMPVLIVEEVGYNHDGRPVLYEVEYLLGDRMRFDLVRRRRRSAGAFVRP